MLPKIGFFHNLSNSSPKAFCTTSILPAFHGSLTFGSTGVLIPFVHFGDSAPDFPRAAGSKSKISLNFTLFTADLTPLPGHRLLWSHKLLDFHRENRLSTDARIARTASFKNSGTFDLFLFSLCVCGGHQRLMDGAVSTRRFLAAECRVQNSGIGRKAEFAVRGFRSRNRFSTIKCCATLRRRTQQVSQWEKQKETELKIKRIQLNIKKDH